MNDLISLLFLFFMIMISTMIGDLAAEKIIRFSDKKKLEKLLKKYLKESLKQSSEFQDIEKHIPKID